MSSGPMGLDAREYGYCFFDYTVTDGASHIISTQRKWLVTKIQVFNGTNGAQLDLNNFSMAPTQIAPDGCLILEPNGAHRGDIRIQGDECRIVIEFWFQTTETGLNPAVTVTP